MTTETVTLRPVTAADAEALSDLVVQLFHTEVPGALRGDRAGHVRLFRYLVEHELAAGVCGRFLAVDEAGASLGSGSVRLFGEPALVSLPSGLLALAARSVGVANTVRMVGTLLRGSLVAETPLRRGECFIYSVVVAERLRGRGIGHAMMGQIEEVARRAGARSALLRVISGNARARSLYLKLGYRVISHTPAWVTWVGMPSELMRKELA